MPQQLRYVKSIKTVQLNNVLKNWKISEVIYLIVYSILVFYSEKFSGSSSANLCAPNMVHMKISLIKDKLV